MYCILGLCPGSWAGTVLRQHNDARTPAIWTAVISAAAAESQSALCRTDDAQYRSATCTCVNGRRPKDTVAQWNSRYQESRPGVRSTNSPNGTPAARKSLRGTKKNRLPSMQVACPKGMRLREMAMAYPPQPNVRLQPQRPPSTAAPCQTSCTFPIVFTFISAPNVHKPLRLAVWSGRIFGQDPEFPGVGVFGNFRRQLSAYSKKF